MCAAFVRNLENVIELGGCCVGDTVAAMTDILPERSVLKEFKLPKGRVKSIFNNFFLNFQHLFFLAQKSPLLSVIVLVKDIIYSVPFTAMLNVIFKLIPLFFVQRI